MTILLSYSVTRWSGGFLLSPHLESRRCTSNCLSRSSSEWVNPPVEVKVHFTRIHSIKVTVEGPMSTNTGSEEPTPASMDLDPPSGNKEVGSTQEQKPSAGAATVAIFLTELGYIECCAWESVF